MCSFERKFILQKTIDLVEKIDMNFEMLNAIIGKDKYLKFSKILNIR